MNRLRLKILAAAFSFAVGTGCAYLAWLVYSRPSVAPPQASLAASPPAQALPSPETEHIESSIEKDWEGLMKVDACLSNEMFDLLDALPSLKSDEPKAVAFLISRIPKTKRTRLHVSPYGMALEGEVALYCLQDALGVPWYELKEEYEAQVKSILANHWEKYQAFLQGKIRNPRGSKELMALWKSYYESQGSRR